MSDDLRVVGEGTLAAAQRWKARAETAEAERDENQRAEADCNAALLLLDEYEGVLEDRVRAVLAERDKQNDALRERLTAAQQEIERLEGQLTTEASLTASWIEQYGRMKARAETAEAERDKWAEIVGGDDNND